VRADEFNVSASNRIFAELNRELQIIYHRGRRRQRADKDERRNLGSP